MLQPDNRLTLIDAMRPPPGYVFDEAMAVTFTLDLRALLAAPAAFALAREVPLDPDEAPGTTGETDHTGGASSADAPQPVEPIELLHAVRTNASRITVFAQAGEIALPPSRRVFAFLEGSVLAVTAPRGGVVHPKVWVLRYRPADGDGPAQLRVLSASRNLTFDTSWDTVLRLDSLADPAATDGASVAPLADLFDRLVTRSVVPPAPQHLDRVASLGADLRSRRFALPEGIDALDVHVLGLTPDDPMPLPVDAGRSLVISPFVTDDFWTRTGTGRIDELVSRAESLDGLGSAATDQVGATYVFDDGSTPDLGDERDDGVARHDPGRPLQGLHAKVFAYQVDGQARLFCGSANATGAAFGSNVEVLVELRAGTDILGIDALCDGNQDEIGLRSLFLPHRPGESADGDAVDDPLDSLRRAMGRLRIAGTVEASGEGWAVTYRSEDPVPGGEGITLACWPLPSPGNRRAVEPGQPLDVRFETSLEHLSAFFVVEARGADRVHTTSLVPVDLEGVPPERDRLLLRLLVGNADRFLRYLLALLGDGSDLGLLDALDAATDDQPPGSDDPRHGAPSLPVLEHLVRALRTDPRRLAAIDPLVTDLGVDDALPDGFAELWAQLRTVAGLEEAR